MPMSYIRRGDKMVTIILKEADKHRHTRAIKAIRELLRIDLTTAIEWEKQLCAGNEFKVDVLNADATIKELKEAGIIAEAETPNAMSIEDDLFENDNDDDDLQSFPLFKQELHLNSKMAEYAKMDGFFQDLAHSAKQDFHRIYDSMRNLDNLMNNCSEKVMSIYQDKAARCVKYLVDRGIYSYREKDFICTDYFVKCFEPLIDKYLSIVSDQEEKERYRELRKQTRGRMVGISLGGGISGAIKASVQAGAVNAATGMAHSAVNSVGNMFSSIGAEINKGTIYRDPSTVKALENAVYMDVYSMSVFMFLYLHKAGIILIGPTDENQNTAMGIFENLQNLPSSENTGKGYEMAFQMFDMNPFVPGYYDYCIQRFPAEQDHLLDVAAYLQINLMHHAESIITSIFNNSSCSTEEQTLDLKKKLSIYQDQLNVNSSKAMIAVDEKLHQFDIEARTFAGKLYDTRELKQAVENDFSILGETYTGIKWATEEVCTSYREGLLKEQGMHYPEVVQMYLDKIDKRIKEIWRKEDKGVLDEIFLKTDIYDMEAKQRSIQEITKIGRTEEKHAYIEALNMLNKKNIKFVQTNIKIVKPVLIVIMVFVAIACGMALFPEGLLISLILIVFVILWISIEIVAEERWKKMTLNETLIHPALTPIQNKIKGNENSQVSVQNKVKGNENSQVSTQNEAGGSKSSKVPAKKLKRRKGIIILAAVVAALIVIIGIKQSKSSDQDIKSQSNNTVAENDLQNKNQTDNHNTDNRVKNSEPATDDAVTKGVEPVIDDSVAGGAELIADDVAGSYLHSESGQDSILLVEKRDEYSVNIYLLSDDYSGYYVKGIAEQVPVEEFKENGYAVLKGKDNFDTCCICFEDQDSMRVEGQLTVYSKEEVADDDFTDEIDEYKAQYPEMDYDYSSFTDVDVILTDPTEAASAYSFNREWYKKYRHFTSDSMGEPLNLKVNMLDDGYGTVQIQLEGFGDYFFQDMNYRAGEDNSYVVYQCDEGIEFAYYPEFSNDTNGYIPLIHFDVEDMDTGLDYLYTGSAFEYTFGNGSESSFIFPYSDSTYLKMEDLQGLSAEECRIARNEIYARHGRIFDDEELQAYFEQFDWYEGLYTADEFKESVLNEYEKANRDLITEYESEMGF